MIYILMIIAAVEVIAIRYFYQESKYWKQVSKTKQEMLNKRWYEDDE